MVKDLVFVVVAGCPSASWTIVDYEYIVGIRIKNNLITR